MQLTTLLATALAGAASLVAAQPGAVYHAVIGLYDAGGCTGNFEPYAVFGATNTCSTIPTNFGGPTPFTTVSAKSTYIEQGCRGTFALPAPRFVSYWRTPV